MDEHTPVRGMPAARDREDTIRAHVPPPGHPESDAPQPQVRRRAWTGALLRSRDGQSDAPSGWPLIIAVLLGSGGTAGLSTVLSPGVEPERVAVVEQRVDQQQRDIGALVAKTKAIEIAAQRDSVATLRWVVDVLSKQNNALTAIAAELNVDVDLTLPPLVVGTPVVEESLP